MEYSRLLPELRRADEPRFGGKSASLGELLCAGIPVPPGFALSVDAHAAFMAAGEAAVPDAVRAELARRYDALGDDVAVAVRSSAVGEDSAEATFAGLQDSYLWVRGLDDVCDAVRRCWDSLYSETAVSYRARFGGMGEPAMGVAVQVMVDAAVSGVMFTCNPVSGDPSMVAINASWGLGLAVVGGEVTPDDFLVSKVTREIVRERLSTKSIEYVQDTGGRGAVRVDVPPERRDAPCLERDQIEGLVDTARRVQSYFGSHQDIEWAIDRAGELYIVQSRPVTSMRKKQASPPADAMSLVMRTFGAT